MTIEEVENAIVDWIELLGMTPIIAYPNAPRPKTSYVLVNVILDDELGTKESDGNTTPIYSSFNQLTISINTYYAEAYQKAIDIKKSLMVIGVEELLWKAGLGCATSTTVEKIPELIDMTWEERAQFDIVFNIREKTEIENVGLIKKIEVNNTTIGD